MSDPRKFMTVLIVVAVIILIIAVTSPSQSHEKTDVDNSTEFDSPDTPLPLDTITEPPLTENTTIEEFPSFLIPTWKHNVTSAERDMLASLVYLEAGNCSVDTQIAVVSVVFNRLASGKWVRDMNNDHVVTLYDIVYYPSAFSVAHNISKTHGPESAYEAVDYVLTHGSVLPSKVCFFRASYDFRWQNYKNYCIMENLYFGYIQEE